MNQPAAPVMDMRQNITDYILDELRAKSDRQITKEDIFYYVYGILQHRGYVAKYANNLSKELPRIPIAPDFWFISRAGRMLAGLHLNYENCERYDLGPPKCRFKKYKKLTFGKKRVPGPDGNGTMQTTDESKIYVDKVLLFDNIPKIRYRVNGRTPPGWAVDRYNVTVHKDSGITNDATRADVVAMIERLVYVGLATDKIHDLLETKEFEPKKPAQTYSLDQFMATEGTTDVKPYDQALTHGNKERPQILTPEIVRATIYKHKHELPPGPRFCFFCGEFFLEIPDLNLTERDSYYTTINRINYPICKACATYYNYKSTLCRSASHD